MPEKAPHYHDPAPAPVDPGRAALPIAASPLLFGLPRPALFLVSGLATVALPATATIGATPFHGGAVRGGGGPPAPPPRRPPGPRGAAPASGRRLHLRRSGLHHVLHHRSRAAELPRLAGTRSPRDADPRGRRAHHGRLEAQGRLPPRVGGGG